MERRRFEDQSIETRRFRGAAPAVIWGALMSAALTAAGVTVWTAPPRAGSAERPIAADENEDLRRDLRALAAERDALVQRLARLERGLGELALARRADLAGPDVTGSIRRPQATPAAALANPAPTPVLPAPAPALPAQIAALPAPVAPPPPAAAPPATSSAEPAAPVAVTLPTAAKPVAPAADAPAQSTKPAGFALSLGREVSVEAARRRWTTLSGRHPQVLSRLVPRAQKSSGAFDLLAGPFPSRAEAESACVALAIQGLACDTTPYGGDPLERS